MPDARDRQTANFTQEYLYPKYMTFTIIIIVVVDIVKEESNKEEQNPIE
jgi:hypothetical protein